MSELIVWGCQIVGIHDPRILASGADGPMRNAVIHAYKDLLNAEPHNVFSGWGDQLSLMRLAVHENRVLSPQEYRDWRYVQDVIDAYPRVHPGLVTPPG